MDRDYLTEEEQYKDILNNREIERKRDPELHIIRHEKELKIFTICHKLIEVFIHIPKLLIKYQL